MEKLNPAIVRKLRDLARSGQTSPQMFIALQESLGIETHILMLAHYFQEAFSLDLAEVKPFVVFTRGGTGNVVDEAFLDKLVMPAVEAHEQEWDGLPTLIGSQKC